ncbi:unnamed protein product [Mycena citricolor]|uniref:Uncharacterized protein n=1 Tax=Mycena citricolor TaxID=2018698 RepID=A0AAD2HWS2_9AGAR|nr:unnamed protein product [Mycena citricolor]CAK5282628.1 unnamed protein product [Mycena citricolor]
MLRRLPDGRVQLYLSGVTSPWPLPSQLPTRFLMLRSPNRIIWSPCGLRCLPCRSLSGQASECLEWSSIGPVRFR